MNFKITKIKLGLMLLIFLVGVALIVFGIVLNSYQNNNTLVQDNNNSDDLPLGAERTKIQNEILEIVENCLKEQTKIEEYLNMKNTRRITMQDLKEEVKIDISKFEELNYGCNNDLTTISYEDDFSTHSITLTCDILLKK